LLARFRLNPAAIQHFQDAIAAHPTSDEARYNLSNAQFLNHEEANALQSPASVKPASGPSRLFRLQFGRKSVSVTARP
jgi:hypothetical protein